MLLDFLLVFVIVPVPTILSAVLSERDSICRFDEFTCNDGACVSLDLYCDGQVHCADGSDELGCNGVGTQNRNLDRVIRQTQCRRNQWQCRDGSCISFDGKCDGIVNCPDGSDESFPLCRNTPCQSHLFRCTYGACVDGTAPCNGEQDCADNSDELLPRCRNETGVIRGQFRCQDGALIPQASRCDGVVDCADGSDETVRACSGDRCASYLFRCAYGACVDGGADCNNKVECADGSDESDELCNRISPAKPTPAPPKPGNCILPPYPAHGRYTVGGAPNAVPGQGFETVQLNVTCNPGYGVDGESVLYCFGGSWSGAIPQCVRFCELRKHPSVDYRCQIQTNSIEGTRECNELEPTGTVAIPECRKPNYYSPGTLNYMRCIDGTWDYVALCIPECGRVTPEGEQLVIGGWLAKRGELPWHAGIYTKTTDPYSQICGGSLVKNTVVISAAHCFWDRLQEKQFPASQYAVALGKLYRPWNNPRDDAQKSDVSDIKIPPRFQGASANFQEDIAIVLLSTPVVYKTYVRPVCVDFDFNFDRRQLQVGKMGKVAGWGLTAADGNASQVLRVVDLPYVSIEECLTEAPPGFREFITSDKICAGFHNGTALCKGDSGGGLVFPEVADRGIERFYLRGVVSTAPNNEHLCNAFTLTTFTQITKHEPFIKQYL